MVCKTVNPSKPRFASGFEKNEKEGDFGLLKQALSEKAAVIVELTPPRGVEYERFIQRTETIWSLGPDAISVTDMPMGKIRISPWAVSHLLVERDIEVLMHFSRTTRNMLRIESDMIGVNLLGIKDLLILSGDDPANGDYPESSRVQDITIEKMVELAHLLAEGTDLAGKKIGGDVDFTIATVFGFSDFEEEVGKVRKRLKAGVDFMVSQPVFSKRTIESFIQSVDRPLKVVVSATLFANQKQLELYNRVPGIDIPESVYRELSEAPEEVFRDKALDFTLSTIEGLLEVEGVCGVYLIGAAKDVEGTKKVIDLVKKNRS